MNGKNRIGAASILVLAVFVAVVAGAIISVYLYTQPVRASYSRFSSCNALAGEFRLAQAKTRAYPLLVETMMEAGAAPSAAPDYSKTNVQVAGVDEADIVKTDGEYIYTLSNGKLIIAKAYPSEEAQILSETDLGDVSPSEIFIDGDMVLIFGSNYSYTPIEKIAAPEIYPYPSYISYTVVQLWDVSDRANPKVVRSVDFEGDYLSSRKIGSQVYFVVNSYPRYYILEAGSDEDIVPLYRDRSEQEINTGTGTEFVKTSKCAEIGYFEPTNPEMFVTIASMSISDVDAPIEKEVIVGSGQNIYASISNLYIAELNYPYWIYWGASENLTEKTFVHKFSLEAGKITYLGNMEAPGRILNQFSMDEYNNYFRIATTIGQVWGGNSTNNVYIYDNGLNQVGKLEGLAPGEQIYSARFVGDRGYLVTFRKVDPLFVIDLSDPQNPSILGKLKIPGYSDYLHPYDENHIIGIGKEAVAAEQGDFAWYQGVKMALFDVTDVSSPIELYKVVIGDRGTDSDVLHDHKAFLFSRERNLLVIPILLAEIDESQYAGDVPPNAYGDFIYQGAYVYELTLDGGFNLRGRITHYETDEEFQKSGYYFRGSSSIRRILYIDDILYTISNTKIKLNSLTDLVELKELKFGG